MYRIPEEQKPEKFTETQEDKKLLEKIDDFDKKMLSYLGRLYKGMTGEKMDFDTIKSSIDALQQYNTASEYKYLDNLLHPEKQKGIKIPSPIPVPSCSFQLHNSITLSTNNYGNLAIVFNPFFLYNTSGLGTVPITGGSGTSSDFVNLTPMFLTSFFVNNNTALDGHTPSDNTTQWTPVNIGQGIPNVYDQYRLVSGSIVIKYIGRLDSTSGVIGGAIVFDEERNIGYWGKAEREDHTTSTIYSAGNWIKKYGNFDLAMDSFYHQENLCLEGMRELYFPIDNTFEEYMKLLKTDYMESKYVEENSAYNIQLFADQDYYKSGFNQMIYVLGAPASQACFKVDVYLNFECLPNAEFLNYMPITPNNVCIDPYYKKQAIAETQKRALGKANPDEGLPPAPPSIWERMKKKFGDALPGIGKLIANGLINAIPGLKSGLGLAGSLIGDVVMSGYNN